MESLRVSVEMKFLYKCRRPFRQNFSQVSGAENVSEGGRRQGPGGGVVVVHVTHRLVAVVHLVIAAIYLMSLSNQSSEN